MKRYLLAVVVGLMAVAMFGGVASAAKPVVQGCIGESIAAQAGPGFGGDISNFARDYEFPGDRPGMGDEVQFTQAGGTPDFIFPNTCND